MKPIDDYDLDRQWIDDVYRMDVSSESWRRYWHAWENPIVVLKVWGDYPPGCILYDNGDVLRGG